VEVDPAKGVGGLLGGQGSCDDERCCDEDWKKPGRCEPHESRVSQRGA